MIDPYLHVSQTALPLIGQKTVAEMFVEERREPTAPCFLEMPLMPLVVG